MGCVPSKRGLSPSSREYLDRCRSLGDMVRYLKKNKVRILSHQDRVIITHHICNLSSIELDSGNIDTELLGSITFLCGYNFDSVFFEKILSFFENKFYSFFTDKKFTLFEKKIIVRGCSNLRKGEESLSLLRREVKEVKNLLSEFRKIYFAIKNLSTTTIFKKRKKYFIDNYITALSIRVEESLTLIETAS